MKKVNIAAPEFEWDPEDADGFRTGMFRFGKQLDAKQMGTTVYEIPPGEAVCPYHYEYAEEEWLLVLSGTPSVRHPGGTEELEPWDVVLFETGPDGAHQIRNDGEETARVLMYSTVMYPAATVYPDSEKIAVWTGNRDDDVIVRRSSGVDYYEGETG
jgi:uncharacterized cupin superfamily protein